MDEQSPIPIAVIGIGCRFAGGANDPEKLWSLLEEGRSAWSEVPADRFNSKAFYHPDPDANGALNHRGGHFLDQDVRAFDADFFGIPPVEAQAIDPQQRMQLETAYEALENAGLPLEQVRGSDTAVYVAVFSRDYDRVQYSDQSDFAQYTMLGTGDAIMSNRISYVFDLKGPSMTLDTGCSGSLVALHQACQSLRARESGMALVGGTNLILSPDAMIPMSLLHILNSDGKCYSFDDRGSGYGRGEGVATVVLKRLDDAIRSGDPIRAVIRHTGINQDGKTKGITLPSQSAQQSLIESVYRSAGLAPRDIGYLETHGTGTVAGDSAEVKAIENVFDTSGTRNAPLYLGSVKANIGHCESSSGIAGLIKSMLVLEKGLIPPNINLKTMKKELTFDPRTIKIPTELVKWPETAYEVRRASVNSFGYGGTNGHAVLEQAPEDVSQYFANGSAVSGASSSQQNGVRHPAPYLNGHAKTNGHSHTNGYHVEQSQPQTDPFRNENMNGSKIPCATNGHTTPISTPMSTADPLQLLVLSAHSETSLKQQISNTATWSSSPASKQTSLLNLAHTLSSRRSRMRWRCSVIGSSLTGIGSTLRDQPPNTVRSSDEVQVSFVFTGQGSQWPLMGRELMDTSIAFSNSLRRSDEYLQSLGAEWSLMEELSKDKASSRINESQIAQPGTTALQIALVDLLHSFKVTANSVIGHSSGEIAAAYAAGILTRDDALKVAYHRGFASEHASRVITTKGAMLAVGLGEAEVLPHLAQLQQGGVCVACVNSPSSVTISGDVHAIEELKVRLDALSVFNRRLLVDTAYHSHHMKAISDTYKSALKDLTCNEPDLGVTFQSTVTGSAKRTNFGPTYWTDNLVSKVRFFGALEGICRHSTSDHSSHVNAFLEIGPHSALSGPVRQTITGFKSKDFGFFYAPTLVRSKDAVRSLLELSGSLFNHGYEIDLERVNRLSSSVEKLKVVRDLPPYPWNHATKFWHESRLSKEHRLRSHPWHDLLGVRTPSSNIYEPTWRNIVGLDNLPWLKDHVVDSLVVWPGAAYLCSAIEALRQTSADRGSTSPIRHFAMKGVVFSKALVIPQSPSKVEIQLCLRPSQSANDSSHTRWEHFEIYCSASEGSWHSHCEGLIRAEFPSSLDEVELDREEQLTIKNDRKELDQITERCTQNRNVEDMYHELRSNGNNYGPNFSILKDLNTNTTEAVGTVRIPNVADSMPSSFMQPHIVHPTTLDSLFHVNLPLFHASCSKGAAIPVSIKELTISCDILCKHSSELVLATKLKPEGPRSAQIDISAFQTSPEGETQPVIYMRGCELRGIGETGASSDASHDSSDIVHQVVSAVDVDCLDADEIKKSQSDEKTLDGDMTPEQRSDELSKATSYYIKSCLDAIASQKTHIPEKHHEYLLSWMQRYTQSPEYLAYLDAPSDLKIDASLRLNSAGAHGEMLLRTGENLHAILAGKMDPLSLMLEDGLLYRVYADDSSLRSCAHLVTFIKSLLFKSPFLNVLEIGAGTGGTTLPLLQALSCDSMVQLERYDFTDVSSGFFEPAKELLREWSHFVDFKKLDIEQDPAAQGFEAGSYDLIVASNVLHATSPLDTVMGHVQKLLKPTGKLAMIELTILPPYTNLIFGLLPGWWKRIDEGHVDGPILSADQWDETLQRSGFTGTEVVVNDYESSAHKCSLLISGVSHQTPEVVSAPVEVRSFGNGSLSQELEATLLQRGYRCQRSSNICAGVSNESIYVVLDSGERPILEAPSDQEFAAITSLLTRGKRVLWVSRGAHESANTRPENGLITGLSRVARAENSSLELVTLTLDRSSNSIESKETEIICDVLLKSFGDASPPSELEYTWRDGKLYIDRLIADTGIGKLIDPSDSPSYPIEEAFNQISRSLKLHVASPGLLDSMTFIDDGAMGTELAPDEIQIEAKAFGINFKDVFIALGQMKDQKMTGESSGIVIQVGSALKSEYRVGDRVCGWRGTPYASHPRYKGTNVIHIPDDMSFETAASIPVVYMTAYYSLVEVARLSKGDKVLIHAASGGVGQAAIQIAQALKAEIFATVGSASKKQLIMDKYSIPESHIFSSRSRNFKPGILRLTEGMGVNVILNSLSGEYLEDTWDCIARFGTFIDIGKTDIYRNGQLNMSPFDRNVNFSSVDLVLLADHRGPKMKALFAEVMSMFQDGRLKPVHPVTTMPIGEIEGAFRLIQGRKHVGKLVLQVDEHASVKAIASKPTPLQLDNNATYIVAGGRGSIGRSIVRLMIGHGAQHIVVLSRRDFNSQERDTFEREIEIGDAEVRVIPCDVTDAASLQRVINDIKQSMPPIKGVIQAAMVLQDRVLEQMTAEVYMRALCPKMIGTRNLVSALSNTTFDFFIMLSSTCSILGHSGQANYAAGCAYQDALAHGKQHTNAHYVSLNLGMVEDTDVITSQPEVHKALVRAGCRPIKVRDASKLLEYCMGAKARADGIDQVVIGLNRESISTPAASSVLRNPLFHCLPKIFDAKTSQTGAGSQLNVADALAAAGNADETLFIVASAISKKMSALISLGDEEIDILRPINSLGLDSLIAIELKNWIVQTFHSPLQSSEILDSKSIRVLSETVADRSTLTNTKEANSSTVGEETVQVEEARDSQSQKLPTVPLPQLADSLDRFVEGVECFCSPEELSTLSTAIEHFKSPNGPGSELHGRLEARFRDTNLDDWLYDLFQVDTWTRRRVALNPWGHFFGVHPDQGTTHSQARRAAIISDAALRFKQRLRTSSIEPEYMIEQPLDMNLHQYIFNSYLEPSVGNDKIQKTDGHDCIVVLRSGHIYRIEVDPDHMSLQQLESQFEAILEISASSVTSFATLTADERDSWAQVRGELTKTDPSNLTLLQTIESSAFVVCLDDSSPSTPSERVNQFLLGGPSNRWSDKSLQFVICTNGTSAVLAEHAMLDGDTLNQLHEAVNTAIKTSSSSSPSILPQTSLPPPEELSFTVTPSLTSHISRVHSLFYTSHTPYSYHHFTFPQLSNTLLRAHKLAPNRVVQITIQLAGLLFFNRLYPCMEPVSMRPFHKGRLDFMLTTVPAVYAFCTAAAETLSPSPSKPFSTKPTAELKALLTEATRSLTNLTTNTCRGWGWRNHFLALRQMVDTDEGEEMPAFFAHPSFERIGPSRISTDNIPWKGLVTEAGFHRPGEWKVWVHYEVEDSLTKFAIKAPPGEVERFWETFERAAGVVVGILGEV